MRDRSADDCWRTNGRWEIGLRWLLKNKWKMRERSTDDCWWLVAILSKQSERHARNGDMRSCLAPSSHQLWGEQQQTVCNLQHKSQAMCHHGFKVSCARTYPHSYNMLRNTRVTGGATVECSCWPFLCHCSASSLDPVCSTLCSHCHNCLLARHVILHDFLWHVQCMVHSSQALGGFYPFFFEPVGTSPHPAISLRKVGLLSSQSEPWVHATCSLKIEHPWCVENQALANRWSLAEHVLLYALVKYTIQLAL